MTPFDPHPAHFDPDAFPAPLRALSLVLSLAIVGFIFFQTAATASAVVV